MLTCPCFLRICPERHACPRPIARIISAHKFGPIAVYETTCFNNSGNPVGAAPSRPKCCGDRVDFGPRQETLAELRTPAELAVNFAESARSSGLTRSTPPPLGQPWADLWFPNMLAGWLWGDVRQCRPDAGGVPQSGARVADCRKGEMKASSFQPRLGRFRQKLT